MFLALREIRHEPVRFTLIISVITLVAYLTFFLASLAVGLAHRYRAGIDGWKTASVAVTDASNENLSASRLSDKQLEDGMTEKKAMAIINKAKKTGNWKEVEKEGLMNFKRDTLWVAVTDTIYAPGFNADSLRYVPFGNGVQFEMVTRSDTTKSGAPLNLFQAQTPYETYLGGLNTQELANLKDLQTKLGKYCGLRVGDIEQPNNNAGNWE